MPRWIPIKVPHRTDHILLTVTLYRNTLNIPKKVDPGMEHINYIRYVAQAARCEVTNPAPNPITSTPPLSSTDSGYVPLYPSLKPVSLRSKIRKNGITKLSKISFFKHDFVLFIKNINGFRYS